ncbi:class I SAM-dependent methyltransferase [Ilumatobacter sp.]|uniref:class I SAM-dependent methyltransferase n=1 Tax=Ilumatobacter sp. TaxID=1967498 RepID=UPI003AF7DB88
MDANVAGNNYDKYATTNPIEQRMMRGFFDALDEMLGDLTPSTVVEVGAGEGRVTERLVDRFPDATVIGLDLVDDELAGDWAELGLPMFFGDATRLPFTDRSIDLVVGLEVLEHVPGPESALREIARVCRGAAVLSVPREPIWRAGNMARGRYLGDLGNTPGHVNHWSSRAFRQFVAAEFDVQASRRPLPWTMVRATPRQPA